MSNPWPDPQIPPSAIRQNIDIVANLEEEFIRARTLPERIADTIADFAGSLRFVVLHIVIYATWIAVNLGVFSRIRPFDPFPFPLLNMSVSVEAIFLATFVLVKQNRMSRRADQRGHLDLQVNLLAEREMTAMLQMLQRISQKLGVPHGDDQLKELAKETSLEALANHLQEKIPQ